MNVQDECIKIHSKFGMSEMANYKIQLLFDSEIEKVKKEYEEKIRWIPVEEKLPESTKFVLCKCEVNGRVDYIVSKYYKSGWQLHVFYSKVVKVTHWRSFL